jgi:hypothetical protein
MHNNNRFNLMFDPKKSRGIVSSYYSEALSEALIVASQLQVNLSARGLGSEGVFWGSLSDIRNAKACLPNENDSINSGIETSDIPKITDIDFNLIELSQEQEADCNSKDIAGFVKKQLPIKYNYQGSRAQTKLTIYENKDIYALNEHAIKNGLITEEQKTKIDELTALIDPESKKYIGEVGILNDIKKATVLFIEQKVFKGGSYYLDIDRAERLKEFYSSKYTRDLGNNASLPAMYNMNGQEIDFMVMQNGRTDENKLFSVIDRYHDSLIQKKKDKNPKYAHQTGDLYSHNLTDKLYHEHYVTNPELNIWSVTIAASDPMKASENDFFMPERNKHKGRTWANGVQESKERY